MKPTVGQQLQRAREQAGINLDDAAHETHIRAHYLQNLEDDHPELLHSVTQARGFLRLYAEFLGLSYPDLLAQWETLLDNQTAESAGQASAPASTEKKSPLGWLKKILPDQSRVEHPGLLPREESGEAGEAEGVQAPVDQPAIDIPVERNQQPQQESELEDEVESRSIFGHSDGQQAADHEEAVPPTEQKEELTEGTEDTEDSEVFAEQIEGSEELPAGFKGLLIRASNALTGIGSRIGRLLPGYRAARDGQTISEDKAKNAVPQTSQEIFKQIGGLLQSRRKAMELSLTDIENFTNLKRAFLIALEEGRFDALPSTVQGRGMLNNYAQFLGMEETTVMDLFGRALQLQREEHMRPQRKPEKPAVSVKVNVPERWRKIINPDLIIGSVLIVGLFVFIIWGASQVFSHSGGGPTEAPSISEMLQTTPSESPEPNLAQTERAESTAAAEEVTPVPGVSVVEPTPTIVATVNTAPLQLVIIAHDRAFLRITVDGVQTFSGRLAPNNVYSYSGNDSIVLLTGNAAALEVYFNQEYIGSLGDVGEVVNMDFTLNGLITPSPAATRTATPQLPTPELPTPEATETEMVPTQAAPTEAVPAE